MHIEKMSVYIVRAPLARAYWMSLEPYSEASEIVVELRTDEGVTGLGEIHGRPMDKIVEILRDGFAPLVMGRNPLESESSTTSFFNARVRARERASIRAADSLTSPAARNRR